MKLNRSLLFFAAAGVMVPLASYERGDALGAVYTAVAAVVLAAGAETSVRPVRELTVFAVILHLLGFWWLADTITLFGGFPAAASWLLFLLYAVVSSLQFTLCGCLLTRLRPTALGRAGIAFPVAWLVTEWGVPRMFPWYLAHFMIPWQSFAGLAEFVGVAPLSALLLWWASLGVAGCTKRQLPGVRSLVALGVTVLLVALSAWHEGELRRAIAESPTLRVALVQGNLGTRMNDDARARVADVAQYRDLSFKAKEAGAQLVIWPESAVASWIPEETKALLGTPPNPAPGLGVPLLYGGLSFRKPAPDEIRALRDQLHDPMAVERAARKIFRFFNTAIGVDPDGTIVGKYHKKVLMPFGEYLPFSDWFPFLKEISPHTGDFSKGDLSDPIPFTVPGLNEPVRAGVLICYEDLIPGLGRDAVHRGANVLVNMTNDVWYGQTPAPYQHHILASWRAIETRRYLLRTTNTGLTAIVTPFGETKDAQPIFTAATAIDDIQLLAGETFYAQWGELPVEAAILLLLALAWQTRSSRKDDSR